MKRTLILLLTLIMVLGVIVSPAMAAAPAVPVAGASAPTGRLIQPADATGSALYIVQLADAPLASYYGGVESFAATSPRVTGARKLDMTSAASQRYMQYLDGKQATALSAINKALGRTVRVAAQWNVAYNGFSIELSPVEAAAVAKLSGVRLVQREFMRYPQTDFGPQWIGASNIWNGAATGSAYKGEGVIAGIIDTGLNLGHPSFADVGGDGYNHTNPLGAGTYLGLCASNPGTYVCNDKTFGFYIFTGETTEDGDGHGSHTGSTTAGNYLPAGTVDLDPYGVYSPAISGVAPHANIVGYKACLDVGGCPGTALISSINQATADGVDVINYSIGGSSTDPWTDADALAFLAAQDAGVVPVTSAGNSGPGASTVGSPADAPWVVGVGASTHNRAANNGLINMSGGSTTPPANMAGKGFADGVGPAPLVYAGTLGDALCLNPFAAGSVTGKIVVCDRGTNARVAKGYNVLQGGAAGMVLVNTAVGQSMNGDVHWLPAVQLASSDGTTLKTWLASGSGHMGTIAGANIDLSASNGDIMAGFSSRGPILNTAADVIKPDVTAPGVDILAAYRDVAPDEESPTRNYAIVSGTSMSSPHTAGAAVLLKGLHPAWTPAEVKSALMSTAKVAGVLKEDGATPANPFDMGAGRVQVDQAATAMLLLDVPAGAYQAANPGSGGDPKSLNMASMANDACGGTCSWTRTVKATAAGSWTASTVVPTGMTLTVTPSSFSLAAGGTQVLTITADVAGLPLGTWAFAQVNLTPPAQRGALVTATHMPVAVKPSTAVAVITTNTNGLSSTQPANTTTNQSFSIGNTGGVNLNWTLFEDNANAAHAATLAWNDNFDAYAIGSQLVGQGGWEGWGGSAAAGALTSSAQAKSAPNSAAILGGSDLVHQYSGYTSGVWNYTAWQYIPDNYTGDSAFILLNQYTGSGGNWSTEVTFRGSTNQVINLGGQTLPLIRGRWVEIRVEINLDADMQTFFYDNQVLFMDSWTDGASGGGSLNIAAVDLYANGASVVYYDDISLTATVATCATVDDIPWASASPTSGTTLPASSTPVNVAFNATGMAVGTYHGMLCVESNDPVSPLKLIPLTLVVTEPATALVCNAPMEGFETGVPPTSWLVQTNEPDGAQWGTIADCGEAGNYTNGSGEAACVSSDVFGEAEFDTSLVSPPLDLTGASTVMLNYTANYQNFAALDFLDLDISTDGGATWTTLLSWNEDHGTFGDPPGVDVSVDLSAYANTTGALLRWHYYDPNTDDWDWYAQIDNVAVECAAAPPNIVVDPEAVALKLFPDETATRPMVITNSGEMTLTWRIQEEDTTSLPQVGNTSVATREEAGATSPAAAQTAATKVEKWQAPAAVLFDNGPLVTHPGGGAGGADESRLQGTSLGMTTLGFGDQVSAGNWVADDFTVTDASGWTVNSATFFHYQTGSTTTSTITGMNWVLYNGDPSAGGAAIASGNTMMSTAWSNIYRTSDTTVGNTQRPIMASVVDMGGLFLPSGSYWLVWQANGSLSSGPWAPPITILGQATTGNGKQFIPASGWATANDGGSLTAQGFPFILQGDLGGSAPDCTFPTDVPWLSVSPTNGSTGGGMSSDVTLGFDSTGLAVGVYTANVCVTSNDPDAGPGNETNLVVVPVTLTISEPRVTFSCEYPVENFEAGVPPLGWSVVNNVAGGPTWTNLAACGQGNYTGGAGDAACMSVGTLAEQPFNAELRTPVFDLVGYNTVTVSYLANFQAWSGIDRLNLDISTDAGATWSNLLTWNSDMGSFMAAPGVFPTVDLSAYAGMSNLMLRWHYYYPQGAGLGWYAQVDEAHLKCTQGPPTAVTLAGVEATAAQSVPAGLPAAALPVLASLALGAAYVARRKQ
ncbi:MAG: S8 family serine peptidase [Caldilineales bacterium]